MPTDAQRIDVEVVPPNAPLQGDTLVRLMAYILDDLIPIPGTKYRIGLDPIIGLIPGFGDTSTAAMSALMLIRGAQAGVPRIALARMALNILLNTLFGALPGIGDVFSAWFKSNARNYRILSQHVSPSGGSPRSTTGDWAFVIGLVVGLMAIVIGISVFVAVVTVQIVRMLTGH